MEDEGCVADLDELRDVIERTGEVDVRMMARAEDAEPPVQPDVEARRLHAAGVERLDADPSTLDLSPDVAVGEDHQGLRIRARSAAQVATASSASATGARS